MNKALKKITVFFGVCFASFLISGTAGARQAYYEIPKPKNFNPNVAVNEIETAVNQSSVVSGVTADDGKIYIDGETAAQKNLEAVTEIEDCLRSLNDKGMYLNRKPVNTVTVRIEDADLSDFVEIVIDSDNMNKIADINDLKIVPGNDNEYIALSKESINYIADNYREFRVQIKKLSDTYTVRFLDNNSNIIGKYGVNIKIALPAEHSEQTVYLFVNNQHENWGGQYNAADHAIEFMTKYSGEYNVASPETVIDDINELSEYEKQAIRFMVIRGYFDLDNNRFDPQSILTRYDFAESL
ncbi:MAG: hypothetical protein J1F64_06920, partial [Oscillospiraceae bacterium]|nr:hypothetical protein [Oscillospiraceae bacterium]